MPLDSLIARPPSPPPAGSGGPMLRLPRPVAVLLGLLVAVALLRAVLPAQLDQELTFALALVLHDGGGLEPARLHTILTYALLHGDWLHLFFNGFWIAALGTLTHRVLGTLGFVLLFAVSVVAGALAAVIAYWGQDVVLIGASGGVFGLIGAFGHYGVAKPWEPLPVRLRKLALFSLVMMAINLAYAYLGGVPGGGGIIAWQAHAGGFLAGLLLFPLLARLPGARHAAYLR